MREVVIVGGARSAIGTFGGGLKDVPGRDLGSTVIKEALNRSGVKPEQVQHVVIGNVVHADAHDDPYLARVVSVKAGIPVEVPGLTLNRRCGSGLEAICTAARMILLDEIDVAVAGGVETMSRVAYHLPLERWGARMGHGETTDALVAALNDPFHRIHMGVTAENLAERYEIPREKQDEFAMESNRRAIEAIDTGRFKEQIVPIPIKSRKGETFFDTDEHPKRGTSLEQMASLRPVFKKDGTVTAGNASGINDGAAAVVLMSREKAAELGLKARARLVGFATAGVEPTIMGIGPVPAVQNVMRRTGHTMDEFDVIELNEAFAAQALSVMQDLDMPWEKTNPNGGAVALGHPVGATGAILTVKALYELERIDGDLGLITMCIGGGEGIAAIIQRENGHS